jgi:hypothetical protein
MDSPTSIAERAGRPYITTGHLPDPEMARRLPQDARIPFSHRAGALRVPSDLPSSGDEPPKVKTWPLRGGSSARV